MILKSVLCIAVLFMLTSLAFADRSEQARMNTEWIIGPTFPIGGTVDTAYGDVWLNLGAKYTFNRTEKAEQSGFFDLKAGSKNVSLNSYLTWQGASAKGFGRLFSFGYAYRKVKAESPLYLEAGLAASIVNTELQFDAGEGRHWTSNGEQIYDVSTTKVAPSAHVALGYRIKEKITLELKYTYLNADFAGNSTPYYNLPTMPETSSQGFLSLTGNFRF